MRTARRVSVLLMVAFLGIAVATGVVCAEKIVYHGNTQSKVFHRPICRYYNCGNCTKKFNSRQEAIDAGYRPCRVCNP
jgi:methylphosphotriester-DNA--protein-cysteine methyltransferase